MTFGEWAGRLIEARPTQPDRRSCGASVLVVEHALRDETYAEHVVARGLFGREVLAMHQRSTGPTDGSGRLQLPWPRGLGTPPWAIARQLARPGRSYATRVARWRRRRVLLEVRQSLEAGYRVPFYVGNRWLPRHVVLALEADDAGLRCYEPSTGRVVVVSDRAFVGATLDLAGWGHPWLALLPRRAGRRRNKPQGAG